MFEEFFLSNGDYWLGAKISGEGWKCRPSIFALLFTHLPSLPFILFSLSSNQPTLPARGSSHSPAGDETEATTYAAGYFQDFTQERIFHPSGAFYLRNLWLNKQIWEAGTMEEKVKKEEDKCGWFAFTTFPGK